jgi:DNA-directed RNA polymerase beta' subunit
MLNTGKVSNVPFSLLTGKESTRKILAASYKKIKKGKYQELTSSAASLQSTLEVQDIDGTRLSFLTHEDIVGSSVCECVIQNTSFGNVLSAYDPREGTIDDPRMGTLEKDMACETCGQNTLTCPGHEGCISFSDYKMVNPLRSGREILTYLLNSFCVCGKPLWTDDMWAEAAKYTLIGKLTKLADRCSRMSEKLRGEVGHRECERRVFFKTPKNTATDTISSKKKKNYYFSICMSASIKDKPTEVHDRIDDLETHLLRIMQHSQQELYNLGFRPRDSSSYIDITGLILKSIPVIPPCARHFGQMGEERIASDITKKYQEVLKQLERISQSGPTIIKMNDFCRTITELHEVVEEKIKGKRGYIRGLAMGKRVNFSGRSVLNPYNTMPFGYIAYPEEMRKLHTTPVALTDFNYTRLTDMLHSEEVVRIKFGPNSDRTDTVVTVTERFLQKYNPDIGDIFEVIGKNGDETMFNRQPTLDKNAIMAYKAFYVPDYKCIGVHSVYTTPHNADFDGDEGNVHKMQTLDARSEARYVASVENNIMNSKQNRPTMGLVYNSISSGYMISQPTTNIQPRFWDSFLKIMVDRKLSPTFVQRLDYFGVEQFSGRALFSILFPENFTYDTRDKANPKADKTSVLIERGILRQGVLTSKHLGPSHGSIVHYMWKTYGMERTSIFFTEAQLLLDKFIEYQGLSIGMSSIVLENRKQVEAIVRKSIHTSIKSINSLPELSTKASELDKGVRESKIMGYLNTVSRIGLVITKEVLKDDNPIKIMSKSGAKGKDANTSQIIGCLGQQYVSGKRPIHSITQGTRSLPYYEPNSKDIEADGFIKESFLQGSTAGGFFHHMAASRIGLMDTAIKTAEIGHMHHRIVKVYEDITTKYDGTIRNTSNTIFSYDSSGGFSAAELMHVRTKAMGSTLSFVDVSSVVNRLNTE